MSKMAQRIAGYGGACLIAGGLVWGGFVYEAEPDVLTLANSVEVQLRLMAMMPAKTEDGAPVAERERIVSTVEDYLDRIERQQPELVALREYRAVFAYLQGDSAAALGHYRAMRGMPQCTPEQRDQSLMKEAQLLALQGDTDSARALLHEHEASFLPANRPWVEKILRADPAKAAAGPASATPAG